MKLYFDLKKLDTKQGTIRVIITDKKNKTAIGTGLKIAITDWLEGRPKQIGKNANINLILNKYITSFDKYITDKQLSNELISLTSAREYITNNVNTVNVERGKKDFAVLLELFKKDSPELTEGAIKPYTTLVNHLADFNPNTQFADINPTFVKRFALYLSTKSKHVKGAKNLQNPTINKMIVTLKAFCKWALKNKHTSATDWIEIKQVKEIDQRIITLTLAELNIYAKFNFGKDTKLAKQRDVFCFATYTGLRFEDLKQINPNNIKVSGDDIYLHINTDKTQKELKLKLVKQAKQLLIKYNYELPIISNQKTNLYIKEGLKKAEINRTETVIVQHLNKHTTINKPIHELLSIHDARKCFVSFALQGGMSITEVMQMSTHKDYRSFARYVQLENERINNKLQSVFSLKKVS